MNTKLFSLVAAVAGALTLAMAAATPASAALTLAAGEEDCDLYSSAGCLFTYADGDGNIFDNASAFEDAYNAVHLANPPPQVLELGDLTDKFEFSGDNVSEAIVAPFDVSFFTVKAGSGKVVLYGLNPADNLLTAINTRITNNKGKLQGISHVTVFGTSGGGGNAVPEPATWAMMILGFGAVGSVIRRRRTAAFTA